MAAFTVPSPFGRGAGGKGGADRDASDDWTYVDIDTFEATF
jgi:hypothetical protein